jgi:hypothetical protein
MTNAQGGPYVANIKEEYQKHHMSEENRQNIYRLLGDISRILDREKIRYHASGGTLLGIYRHSDVVPHDNDIDFDVHEDDYSKLYRLLDEFMDLGYQVQFLPNILKIGIIGQDPKKHVVADFFPYRITDNVEMADPYHRQWWPQCYHHVKDCFPIVKRQFGPLMINCPNDGAGYLDRYYPNWREVIIIDPINSHRVTGDKKDYIIFNVKDVL